jgi:hypothetical protein
VCRKTSEQLPSKRVVTMRALLAPDAELAPTDEDVLRDLPPDAHGHHRVARRGGVVVLKAVTVHNAEPHNLHNCMA